MPFTDHFFRFGNFIGEAVSDEEASQDGAGGQHYVYDEDSDAEEQPAADGAMDVDDEGPSNAVTLHEDKQYYPTAQQIYGEDVETMVQEEDAQPLTQPIIAPVTEKKFQVQEADLPPVYYSREFMTDLLSFPEAIRNIAVAGHLHHGKTAFVDMLVTQTHDIQDRLDKRIGRRRDEQLRYTDTHFLERERGLVHQGCADQYGHARHERKVPYSQHYRYSRTRQFRGRGGVKFATGRWSGSRG